jgi:hypothetical protein
MTAGWIGTGSVRARETTATRSNWTIDGLTTQAKYASRFYEFMRKVDVASVIRRLQSPRSGGARTGDPPWLDLDTSPRPCSTPSRGYLFHDDAPD